MKKLLANFGVDRAVTHTLIGRVWALLSGILNLLLIVRFLTKDEQGYYYTFASLLAMQILFELGMSYVVMQFASHEMANLEWSEEGTVEGDLLAKTRLRSLLMFVTKWYGVIAALIILVILPMGWIFFYTNHPQSGVNWQIAWVWLVVVAAINNIFLPVLAIMEGCGQVAEVAKLRMYQNIIGSLAAWVFLFSGGGLLSMPAMTTGMLLTVLIWVWNTKRKFLQNLLSHEVDIVNGINWKNEIWPFQWRVALSWLSGYFIFQLFTPVTFAYHGATEAGKMGVSFSIASALMTIPMAWMNTQSPKFGMLISKKDYKNLDNIFYLTLIRSLAVMILIAITLCIISYFAHIKNFTYSDRVLEPLPFAFLMVATVLNYVTYAQSAYLRAHKEEPFLLVSLVTAVSITTSTFYFVKQYGSLGIMFGYLTVSTVVGFCWGSVVFFSKRRKWQSSAYLM